MALPNYKELLDSYNNASPVRALEGAPEKLVQGYQIGDALEEKRQARQQQANEFSLKVKDALRKDAEDKRLHTPDMDTADVLKGFKVDPTSPEGQALIRAHTSKISLAEAKDLETRLAGLQSAGLRLSGLDVLANPRILGALTTAKNSILNDKPAQDALGLLNRTARIEALLSNRDFEQIAPQEKQEIINGISTISIGGKPTLTTIKDMGFKTIPEAAAKVQTFLSGSPVGEDTPNVIALLQAHLNREREVLKNQYQFNIDKQIRSNLSILKDHPEVLDDIREAAKMSLKTSDPRLVQDAATAAAGQTREDLSHSAPDALKNPVVNSIVGGNNNAPAMSSDEFKKKWLK